MQEFKRRTLHLQVSCGPSGFRGAKAESSCSPCRRSMRSSQVSNSERLHDALKEYRVHSMLGAVLMISLMVSAQGRGMNDQELDSLGRCEMKYLGLAAVNPDNGVHVLAHVGLPKESATTRMSAVALSEMVTRLLVKDAVETPRIVAAAWLVELRLCRLPREFVDRNAQTRCHTASVVGIGLAEVHQLAQLNGPVTRLRRRGQVVDG